MMGQLKHQTDGSDAMLSADSPQQPSLLKTSTSGGDPQLPSQAELDKVFGVTHVETQPAGSPLIDRYFDIGEAAAVIAGLILLVLIWRRFADRWGAWGALLGFAPSFVAASALGVLVGVFWPFSVLTPLLLIGRSHRRSVPRVVGR